MKSPIFELQKRNTPQKLIGVQSNHGVEYFGGPAGPTHQLQILLSNV